MSETPSITVTIRLFASLREKVGMREISLALPAGATAATARNALLAIHPSLEDGARRIAFAVNRTYSAETTVLRDGDEVALIPPVSGG